MFFKHFWFGKCAMLLLYLFPGINYVRVTICVFVIIWIKCLWLWFSEVSGGTDWEFNLKVIVVNCEPGEHQYDDIHDITIFLPTVIFYCSHYWIFRWNTNILSPQIYNTFSRALTFYLRVPIYLYELDCIIVQKCILHYTTF